MTTSIMDRWRRSKARTTDPETSKAAVATVTKATLNQKQDAVLEALRRLGGRACDQELIDFYDGLYCSDLPSQSPSGLRTRRSELVAMGKVDDIGLRVTLASGREAIVWSLVVTP